MENKCMDLLMKDLSNSAEKAADADLKPSALYPRPEGRGFTTRLINGQIQAGALAPNSNTAQTVAVGMPTTSAPFYLARAQIAEYRIENRPKRRNG